MATPTSVVRGDLAISVDEFSAEADEMGLVGLQVFPPFYTTLQSAQYAVRPIGETLKQQDDTRAPGGAYNRAQQKFKMDNYTCQEHGLEEAVDDRDANRFRRYFDAETVAMKRCRRRLLMNHERRIQAQVQNSTNFTGAQTGAVNAKWNDPVNATPIDDIDKYSLQVRNNCGIRPNKLVITYEQFISVRKTNQIIDRMKFAGIDDPKDITATFLAAIFNLEEVLVASAIDSTANENQAQTFGPIWNTVSAMLAFISDSLDIEEVTLGRTFSWSETASAIGGAIKPEDFAIGGGGDPGIESYRDETVRSNVVRVRMDTNEKLMRAQCGLLITGVIV